MRRRIKPKTAARKTAGRIVRVGVNGGEYVIDLAADDECLKELSRARCAHPFRIDQRRERARVFPLSRSRERRRRPERLQDVDGGSGEGVSVRVALARYVLKGEEHPFLVQLLDKC